MEEELNYSTVVFKNGAGSRKEKNEDSTIYATVKSKEAASTVPKADGERAAHPQHLGLLAGCLGSLCVLLVVCITATIYIGVKRSKEGADYEATLSNLTLENQQLATEKSLLQKKTEELNWTLNEILKFNNFPVNEFCPDKKCQPCRNSWIPFQEKCYLFYDKSSPWFTWEKSQAECKKAAADLVVIDSLQEQEFIKRHIEYYHSPNHGFWIGLRQNDDHDWIWVDDGHIDTLGYWIGETFGDDGPYALMIPGRDATASWDPADVKMENKYICETNVLTKRND